MATENNTKIVITAETGQAERGIKQVAGGLGELGGAAGIAQAALGAIGGAVSVGAIAALAKQTIDAADAMNDLAQRTQIPLAELAKYRLAADQSGTSIEAIARGVKSLSTFMVENGQALRDAGITAKDADGAYRQLADLFKSMPEGPEKLALATKIFNKVGQEQIPILNAGSEALDEWAKKAEKYSQALQELAPKADEFNDHLAELKLNLDGLTINAFAPFMEGLNGLIKFLSDAAAGGERLVKALEFLREFKPFGVAPDGLAQAVIDRKLNELRRSSSGSIGGVSAATLGIGTDTADSIMARLRTNALLGGKGDTERAAKVKKEADTWKEFADAIKRAYDNALAWEESGQLIEKQALDQAKALDALNEASETQARNLEAQLENYGLTEGQIQRVIVARLEEARSLTDPAFAEHLAFLDREIEARKRLANAADSIDARKAQEEAKRAVEAAAEESRRQWERITDDINRSLTDAIFEGGKSGGELLADYFKTLVLRPIVQMATQPIANAVGSVFGGGSGGGGLPIPGGGSSLYGSFATSSLGQSLGLSESMAGFAFSDGASAAAAGAQLTSAGSAIGAALPWIGGALAVGSLLGAFDDNGPAQRRGNFRSGLGLSTGVGAGESNNAIDATEWFSGAEMNATLNEFQKQVAAREKAIIEGLGLSSAQINAADAALYALGDRRYGFGMEGSDWRQSGAAEAIIADRTQAISDALGISLDEIEAAISTPIKTLRSAFDDLFTSDADKLARQSQQLADEFKRLGVTMPATRDEFIALVDGSTGRLERGLLKLAPAVDVVFDAAEESARLATAAAEESARQAQALADEIAAVSRRLDIDLLRAQGNGAGALALEREDILAGLDASLRDKQREVWAAEDAAEAARVATAAREAEAESLRQLADQMNQAADSLQRYRDALGVTAAGSGASSYGAARALFDRTANLAGVGDLDAMGNLQGVADQYLSAAAARSRTRLDLARDQARVDAALGNSIGFARGLASMAVSADGTAIVAELAALRADVAAQNALIAANTAETSKYLRRWNGDGMPETRVVA